MLDNNISSVKKPINQCEYCKKINCEQNKPFCRECIILYLENKINSEEIGDFLYHQHYATY
jgi:hypothetical protein